METCANCERVIGNMETPMVWREAVVCGACYQLLGKAPPPPPTPSAPVYSPSSPYVHSQHHAPTPVPSQQFSSPPPSTALDPTRVILALAVVGGIVIIALLLLEWLRRAAVIQSVGG